MNYKSFNLGDWIGHISGVIEDETTLDGNEMRDLVEFLSTLEQEQQTFKWCTDCKEYDQEKHCCHRWSKVIRDTVEEMKQEPILDMINEIIEPLRHLSIDQMSDIEWDILRVIDNYKAENEANNGKA